MANDLWSMVQGREELKSSIAMSFLKLGLLVLIGVLSIGVGIIEWIKPDFFNYPYWSMPLKWDNVWKFYPLFLVGLGWGVLGMFAGRATSSHYDGAILFAESFGYVLTGLWEELLFRWVWIPYAMIFLVFLNWFWGFGLPYLLGIAALGGGVYLIASITKKNGGVLEAFLGVGCIIIAALLFWFGASVDPVYWIYNNILIPIADLATFHMMGPAFTRPADPLFVIAIFSVNSAFRDGHKYQGVVGWINSWYAGMVLIYATLTYGILTAIAVHAIYDIIFAVTDYAERKLRR